MKEGLLPDPDCPHDFVVALADGRHAVCQDCEQPIFIVHYPDGSVGMALLSKVEDAWLGGEGDPR